MLLPFFLYLKFSFNLCEFSLRKVNFIREEQNLVEIYKSFFLLRVISARSPPPPPIFFPKCLETSPGFVAVVVVVVFNILV